MRKITLTTIETPLCPMRAGATERGVCLLEMGSPERESREIGELEAIMECGSVEGSNAHLDQLTHELGLYFRGELTEFTVALDTPGSDWQRAVWDALCTIPYGETTSYGELAKRLGNLGGARAVGLANGSNRVSIVVPCHRVIASDGTLHGYGGGLDRKRWLLDHERTHSGASLFGAAR
jgi:AraC family transcriptional regulator of adaptative response/methylated-DNA-[protein]-cysteine methyltransferase